MKIVCVLAHYNRPRLVREAVKSVFFQEHGDWNLVIVDDDSADDRLFPYDELADRLWDERVIFDRLTPHDQSRGPGRLSRAINHALWVADMRIGIVRDDVAVLYLGDDDWYHPEWFANVSRVLEEEPEVDVVYGRLLYSSLADGSSYDPSHIEVASSRFPLEFATPAQQLDHNQVAHRGSVLGKFDIRPWTEDDAEISAKVRARTGQASRGPDAAFFGELYERTGEWKPLDVPAAFKRRHGYHVIGNETVTEKREA